MTDQDKTTDTRKDWAKKAGVLIEALPFMRRYAGQHLVIKFGGHAMGEEAFIRSFAEDVVLLHQVGAKPVVVHGGGPQIGQMLEKLRIESRFINGLRVTDAATVSVVEMVLAGAINKALAAAITSAGGKAVGISGKDGNLIVASKLLGEPSGDSAVENTDLGFVGTPEKINPEVINALVDAGMIPVIAPVASGADGATYNINADTAAGAVSAGMGARRLLMLTDVAGVIGKDGTVMPHLTMAEAAALIEDGTISGGMIPKVQTCMDAVNGGAEAAVILDGRQPHAVLVELFTEQGVGTILTSN